MSEIKESIKEVFNNHGLFLTIWITAIVIVCGISLVDNPSNWWIPTVAISAFFAVFFLLFNAIVIVKSAITIAFALVFSAAAFQVGALADPTGPTSYVWMCLTLFLFFALLSLSYFKPKGRSRWTAITLSLFTYFFSAYILLMAGLAGLLSVSLSLIISFVVFVLFYFYSRVSRTKQKYMPKNTFSQEFYDSLLDEAKELDWKTYHYKTKNVDAVLAWGNNKSNQMVFYSFYPIEMDQGFGDIGKKHQKLSYKSRSVNPWLLNVIYKVVPSWKLRGAIPFVVLADVNAKNGSLSKVIGVSIPDSKKLLAVGITPAKIDSKNKSKVIKSSIDKFDDFTEELSEKQIQALDDLGKPDKKTKRKHDKVEKVEKENSTDSIDQKDETVKNDKA